MKTQLLVHAARFIIIVSATTLALFGCSSGGGNGLDKNDLCQKDYSPLDLADDKAYSSKVSLKPGEPFLPEVNEYSYSSFSFYYYDKTRDIKIHLQNVYNSKTGESETSVACAGGNGLNYKKTPTSYAFTFVSDIKTAADGSLLIKTRTFQFDLRSRPSGQAPLSTSMTVNNDSFVIGAPQEFFSDFQKVTQYFLKPVSSAQEYLLLSHLESGARRQDSDEVGTSNTDEQIMIRALVKMTTAKLAF